MEHHGGGDTVEVVCVPYGGAEVVHENRPHGPRSASQLTQPVRPFSCHGPTGTITISAVLLGLKRVCRDLEDDLEPVALVP